ncbi:NAD(P)-dependent oxidoreductase [Sphingomonas montana]|uniref:NAD(P)-dependent oxidoreductase n=1 Tax=Sphingomonas montana TaxID=1843236 RepID=UPI00096EE2F0|nr:NAD(P)-dependent oxidoreductase [Sphingomonas montana]
MSRLLIFGLGYTATRLADRLSHEGWHIAATRRTATANTIAFDDEPVVRAEIAAATHILSSVPPTDGRDPVLDRYGPALLRTRWLGYLSSTGVYGDAAGAWVDETAPVGTGRRNARAAADLAWQTLPGAQIFRLPGIYGPGRSALDRVREGRAHRIDLPDQVFSRVHVDDIVAGVLAGMDGPPGVYNLADDQPSSQNAVIEAACDLLGVPWPVLQSLDAANLSPMARGFYAENRRVANGKAKRVLGWRPAFPNYRAGLRALNATTSPAIASAEPTPA